jgi:threonine aldolase
MTLVDLRSDTVTRPGPTLRRVMAEAEVGDDIYGEDPSARRLEEAVAERLGKEAALFVPSGTMGNQIALKLHCRPGDTVLCGQHAHLFLYESGAAGALAGVQPVHVGVGGLFDADDLEVARVPAGAYYMSRLGLVALENTHNRAGGRVWPEGAVEAVAAWARAEGLPVHLDGARLWNAAVARGTTPAALAAPADTVSVCFSKGLGAPVGSALVGSSEAIEEARRIRKMLGGAMRQVGVLCAAARHCLDHHVDRLAEDHARAQRLHEGLADLVEAPPPETNILVLTVPDAVGLAARLKARDVLVGAMGPRILRLVTHLDVDDDAIDRALAALREALGAGRD